MRVGRAARAAASASGPPDGRRRRPAARYGDPITSPAGRQAGLPERHLRLAGRLRQRGRPGSAPTRPSAEPRRCRAASPRPRGRRRLGQRHPPPGRPRQVAEPDRRVDLVDHRPVRPPGRRNLAGHRDFAGVSASSGAAAPRSARLLLLRWPALPLRVCTRLLLCGRPAASAPVARQASASRSPAASAPRCCRASARGARPLPLALYQASATRLRRFAFSARKERPAQTGCGPGVIMGDHRGPSRT